MSTCHNNDVDLSDNDVDLSDNDGNLSDVLLICQIILLLSVSVVIGMVLHGQEHVFNFFNF